MSNAYLLKIYLKHIYRVLSFMFETIALFYNNCFIFA